QAVRGGAAVGPDVYERRSTAMEDGGRGEHQRATPGRGQGLDLTAEVLAGVPSDLEQALLEAEEPELSVLAALEQVAGARAARARQQRRRGRSEVQVLRVELRLVGRREVARQVLRARAQLEDGVAPVRAAV